MHRRSDRHGLASLHPLAPQDIFVLNQHQLTMNCTATDEGFQLLIDSLKLSLEACGRVLLACGKGSGDAPGWAEPAPVS